MHELSSQQMTTSPRLELPCIAFHDLDRSTVLFSMSEQPKRIVNGDADEVLRNKIICPTARGLLLVRDSDTMATFLWNPSRIDDDDKVPLPPLRGVEDVVLMDSHCLLSDKLAAPGGCVVILVEAWRDNTTIWYCHPGDDLWNKYEYDIGSQVLPYPDRTEVEKKVICPIAACQGKFYFNSTTTELGVLDMGGCHHGPTLAAVTIDGGATADGSYGYDRSHGPEMVYLVESGCDLYMVRLLFVSPYVDGGDDIDRCSVHRMDFSKKRWRNVRDLGGHAFFLSEFYFGASCSSGGGDHGLLLPDRVYFVRDSNNTLQVFDVRDGSCQVRKLDEAPHTRLAFWLLPNSP